MNTSVDSPLISVVIATYNGEKFLKKQLDSIINQTYKPIEIIAVDDASTDNTFIILEEYAKQYNHFKVVKNNCNLGYIKNFEKGFSLAQGDYIAPCDQDDIWFVNKLELLLKNIDDYAIIYCNSAFIDRDDQLIGNTLADNKTFTDFDSPLMYVVGASAPSHAMLIKKEIVMKAIPFPELFSHDNWLGFVATFDSSVKFFNQVLVYYRRHDSNVFGGIHKRKKAKETSQQRVEKAQQRLQLLYEKCPDTLAVEKSVLHTLYQSYQDYSLKNNVLRMKLFFKYRKQFLAYKKHTELRRCLYCIKMFFKII